MLENILHMSLICPKMVCCFEARSHSNVDKAISENHSVTSFKIKVAHALKLAQQSICNLQGNNTPCNIALDKSTNYAFALT